MGGEKSLFEDAAEGGMVGGTIGATFGSIAAAWAAKPQVGQRTLPLLANTAATIGSHAGFLGAVGVAFAATKHIAADIRGHDDVYTSMAAGCSAGMVAGVRTGRITTGLGACAAAAAVSAMVKLTHGLTPQNQPSMEVFKASKSKIDAERSESNL